MSDRVRFLLAMVVTVLGGSSVAAQQLDLARMEPLIVALQQDEAEFLAAIAAGDPARLKRLAEQSQRMSFAIAKADPPNNPDDPASVILYEAYVTCANAHSYLGVLSDELSRAFATNAGGDNTAVLNDMTRGGITFFLPPFHEKHAACAGFLDGRLAQTAVARDLDGLLPAFQTLPIAPFTRADIKMWTDTLAGFQGLEATMAVALKTGDLAALDAMIGPMQRFETMIARRDHSELSWSDYAIVDECRWQLGHFRQLHGEATEALSRPEIAAEMLQSAWQTLDQYRETKAGCARALGAPEQVGRVNLSDDALGLD